MRLSIVVRACLRVMHISLTKAIERDKVKDVKRHSLLQDDLVESGVANVIKRLHFSPFNDLSPAAIEALFLKNKMSGQLCQSEGSHEGQEEES